MYTLLKSEIGAFPDPVFPRGIDLAAEDRKARGRLYPVTAIYAVQLATLMTKAVRSGHGARASLWLLAGMAAWSPIEYAFHRFLMHGVFPRGTTLKSRVLHYLFDASHADHHARPWDGMYINGHLDTLIVEGLAMPLALLATPYTATVFVAAVLASYAFEEWVHHATHFWNFDWGYFQYLRRRHMWHHSKRGAYTAYGVTSGLWDVPFRTRIPPRERALLLPGHGSRPGGREAPAA